LLIYIIYIIYITARSFVSQFKYSEVIDRRGQYRRLFRASSESDDDPHHHHHTSVHAANNVQSLRIESLHPRPMPKSKRWLFVYMRIRIRWQKLRENAEAMRISHPV